MDEHCQMEFNRKASDFSEAFLLFIFFFWWNSIHSKYLIKWAEIY